MTEKPALTAKEQAQKSLRLLFTAIYAPADYHIPPNDIYEARRTIETFIESAGVLEGTEPITTQGVNWCGAEFKIEGAVRVYVNGQVFLGRIDAFLEYGVVNLTLQAMGQHRFSWSDIIHWNPDGSK